MSLAISVRADVDRVLRDLDHVQRRLVKRAASRAINQVASAARAATIREVQRRTGVKTTAIRKRLKLTRAKQNLLTAAIWAGLLRVTAKDLGALSQDGSGARAGNFSFPGAFVRTGKYTRNAFKRQGPGRYPIRSEGVEVGGDLDRSLLRQINSVQPGRWDHLFNTQLAILLR